MGCKLHFFIALVAAFICHSHATEDEGLLSEAENEGRIFFANGNAQLSLNTTTIILGLGLLVLLGVLAAVLVGGLGFPARVSRKTYQNYYDPDLAAANTPQAQAALAYASAAHSANSNYYRSKRAVDFNVATKMLQLEDAFKKYEVHEEECRDYVACEAAQVSRLERNGPLVKQVHDILGYGKQFAKYELLQRLRKVYEDGFNRNTEYDACSTYRELCEQSRGGNK